jgi:hypothetical protein
MCTSSDTQQPLPTTHMRIYRHPSMLHTGSSNRENTLSPSIMIYQITETLYHKRNHSGDTSFNLHHVDWNITQSVCSICSMSNIIPDDILIWEGHNVLHHVLILLSQIEKKWYGVLRRTIYMTYGLSLICLSSRPHDIPLATPKLPLSVVNDP